MCVPLLKNLNFPTSKQNLLNSLMLCPLLTPSRLLFCWQWWQGQLLQHDTVRGRRSPDRCFWPIFKLQLKGLHSNICISLFQILRFGLLWSFHFIFTSFRLDGSIEQFFKSCFRCYLVLDFVLYFILHTTNILPIH